MAMPTLSDAFSLPKKSYDFVKQNWIVFVIVHIFTILSSLSPVKRSDGTASTDMSTLGPLDEFSAGVAVFIITLGLLIFAVLYAMRTVLELRTAQGKKLSLGEVYAESKQFIVPLFLQAVVIILIVTLGLILLIIPGLIALGRLITAPYLLVDKNLGVMDSIKASFKLSTHYDQAIWGVLGVLLLIAIGTTVLAVIPFIGGLIGGLIMVAVSVMLAIRYVEISAHRKAVTSGK